MKLATLPALALIASCAASTPDIKPTNVDLQATQTRADLLAQLGTNHELTQNNGDVVICKSIGDTNIQDLIDRGLLETGPVVEYLLKDEAKRHAVAQSGYDACDRALNPTGAGDNCWDNGSDYSVDLKKRNGIFSLTSYCGPGHNTETTCTASVPVRDIVSIREEVCVRVGAAENLSIVPSVK